MNVCTHSYSLVWYGWAEWTAFIDCTVIAWLSKVLPASSSSKMRTNRRNTRCMLRILPK